MSIANILPGTKGVKFQQSPSVAHGDLTVPRTRSVPMGSRQGSFPKMNSGISYIIFGQRF